MQRSDSLGGRVTFHINRRHASCRQMVDTQGGGGGGGGVQRRPL